MKNRSSLAVCALLAAFSLAACSGTPAPADSPSASRAASQAPSPTATKPAAATPTAPAAAPTCETIITAGTVEALKSQGWTFKQEEFKVGSTDVPGGIWCLWADFNAASDQGQTYGWIPMKAAEARNAEARLQADGWVRSNEGSTVFYTEDPDYAIAKDDQGFGMTYEFGDGWVKFADTKQGLLLIDWGK